MKARMDLALYLSTPVKPLADYTPACELRQKEKGKKPARPDSLRCVEANKAAHEQAITRYREVMGEQWVSTKLIESRLGMSRSSCTPNLLKWEKMELVEKRKIGDVKSWTRMKGNEWRFVK